MNNGDLRGSGGASPLRWPLQRPDRLALGLLVVLPVLAFSLPALLGHPPLVGDNLIQNYPLRVLSGRQLASGHLPLWNPLVFSGSPLLGALNAGSLYPGTFAFALFPPMVAWVGNLIACYVAAGVGLYVLARWLGLGSGASLLGALCYGFMGAMVGQMVHLGVIQGQSLLPWMILAVFVIARRLRGPGSTGELFEDVRSAAWPMVWLVVLVALVMLTGEPRSIADMVFVLGATGGWVVLRQDLRRSVGARLALAGTVALSTAWGALLSAAELLPGRAVISVSQRASLDAFFIGSGSLRPNWTSLLAIPDLIGGAGLLHQPTWFIEYNLPEVTGYVGLLALAAFFAAAGQLLRRRRGGPRWLGFMVGLGIFGLFLSWGSNTALFHVVLQIPLVNRTRLWSRNLIIVDLAMAILLAWFFDRLAKRDLEGASLEGRRRWLTVSPLVATVALGAVALVFPQGLERHLGASAAAAVEGQYLRPWIIASVVLAVLVGTLLLTWRRMGQTRAVRAFVSFFVVDLVFFLVACTTGLVSGTAPTQPSRAQALTQLSATGRFALVDPSLATYNEFVALGSPNTNVFTGLPSVQGYGSEVLQPYGQVTQAHQQNNLDACSFAAGRYVQLRLSSLVLGTSELAPQISYRGSSGQVAIPQPPSPLCASALPVTPGPTRTFYLGRTMKLSSVLLVARTPTALATSPPPSVALLDAAGHEGPPQATHRTARGWVLAPLGQPTAVGFVVDGAVHQVLDSSQVTDTTGSVFELSGPYQDAIDHAGWRLIDTTTTYQSFRNPGPLVAAVRLEGAGAGSRVLESTTSATGAQHDVVSLAQAGTLVRSEAFAPGWRATIRPAHGGSSRTVAVVRHDLVQSVALPAGTWTVELSYHPPGLRAGLVLSGVSLAALALVVVWLGLTRARRRETPGVAVASEP